MDVSLPRKAAKPQQPAGGVAEGSSAQEQGKPSRASSRGTSQRATCCPGDACCRTRAALSYHASYILCSAVACVFCQSACMQTLPAPETDCPLTSLHTACWRGCRSLPADGSQTFKYLTPAVSKHRPGHLALFAAVLAKHPVLQEKGPFHRYVQQCANSATIFRVLSFAHELPHITRISFVAVQQARLVAEAAHTA